MNNLEKDFRFDLYLKKQLQHLFIEIIEIQWQTWIIAFPLALISYVIRDAITPTVPSAIPIIVFFTTVSFIPATISFIVRFPSFDPSRFVYSTESRFILTFQKFQVNFD
jgi:MFS superfamily sulfate permease-like transporter